LSNIFLFLFKFHTKFENFYKIILFKKPEEETWGLKNIVPYVWPVVDVVNYFIKDGRPQGDSINFDQDNEAIKQASTFTYAKNAEGKEEEKLKILNLAEKTVQPYFKNVEKKQLLDDEKFHFDLDESTEEQGWRNLKSKFRSFWSPEGACETKNES